MGSIFASLIVVMMLGGGAVAGPFGNANLDVMTSAHAFILSPGRGPQDLTPPNGFEPNDFSRGGGLAMRQP